MRQESQEGSCPPIIDRLQLGLRQRECYGSTHQSSQRLLLPDDSCQRKPPLTGLALVNDSGAFAEQPFPVGVVFPSEKASHPSCPGGTSLKQGDNSLRHVSANRLYFSYLIGPKFALSNCHTVQIGSISHSQAMRDARGRGFRNLPPRILETWLHTFPLDHHHLLSPPRLQVPQVACPRPEGPRVSEQMVVGKGTVPGTEVQEGE